MTDFDRVKEINRLSKIIAESTEDDFIDEFYELSRGKIRFFEDILLEIQDLLDRRELSDKEFDKLVGIAQQYPDKSIFMCYAVENLVDNSTVRNSHENSDNQEYRQELQTAINKLVAELSVTNGVLPYCTRNETVAFINEYNRSEEMRTIIYDTVSEDIDIALTSLEQAREKAKELDLPFVNRFSNGLDDEDFDPYVYDGSMTPEDFEKAQAMTLEYSEEAQTEDKAELEEVPAQTEDKAEPEEVPAENQDEAELEEVPAEDEDKAEPEEVPAEDEDKTEPEEVPAQTENKFSIYCFYEDGYRVAFPVRDNFYNYGLILHMYSNRFEFSNSELSSSTVLNVFNLDNNIHGDILSICICPTVFDPKYTGYYCPPDIDYDEIPF